MGQTSIVLIAGLIFLLRYQVPEEGVEFNNTYIILWTCILTFTPILLTYLTKRFTALRTTIVFDILSLVTYIVVLHKFNLPAFINKHLFFLEIVHHSREIFSLFPLFIGLIGIRVAMHETPHTNHEKRREHINFHFRHLLLPIIPLLVWNGVLDFSHFFPEEVAALFVIIMIIPLLAFPYILAPYMMQFLWKTKPLTDTILIKKLVELTKRSKMKFRDIAVLQTGDFEITNAAVAGILPRNRRIFLTDSLLRNFTDEQIETIVAHEIGHIRHRHLLISCFIVFGYILSYAIFYQLVGKPLMSLLEGYPIISSIVTLLFFVFYFRVFFNFLSRRFEYQADLYAADLTNNPEGYKSALKDLGSYSAFPKLIRLIIELINTHPSIDRRIEFIDQSIKDNNAIHRYRKCLLEVKLLFAIIPIMFVLIYLINL
ncbi:MAG: M48 family metalloprotease [Candidatus Poribacteria bacterium]|nr:M48 family metalloprotease [Candidatus Poribacteria bacterium]